MFRPDLKVTEFVVVTVRSNSVDQLILPYLFGIPEGLHRRPAAAHLALIGSLMIIVSDPDVKIGNPP